MMDRELNQRGGRPSPPRSGPRETAPAESGPMERGVAGWLLQRLRGAGRTPARLALLERIAVTPRQSLALIEADGRRFLVGSSADGGAVFYPLEERVPNAGPGTARSYPGSQSLSRRVSW